MGLCFVDIGFGLCKVVRTFGADRSNRRLSSLSRIRSGHLLEMNSQSIIARIENKLLHSSSRRSQNQDQSCLASCNPSRVGQTVSAVVPSSPTIWLLCGSSALGLLTILVSTKLSQGKRGLSCFCPEQFCDLRCCMHLFVAPCEAGSFQCPVPDSCTEFVARLLVNKLTGFCSTSF